MTDMEIKARRNEEKKAEAFEKLLSRPETKLLLSLVPSSDNPDALRTLLCVCFNGGYGHGQAEIVVELVEAMFKERGKL